MKKLITIIAFIFITTLGFGQDYKYIDAETLNIREQAGKEYNVIGKLKMGDKVLVVSENNAWTEIETDKGIKGYVASNFLTTDSANNSSINDIHEEMGFKYGFYKGFKNLFIIILLISTSIVAYKSKRIKDGRFKNGIRNIPFTTFEMIKFIVFSAVICSIVGVFIGIYYWIKSF
jgi:uncharacterized protein YgiM (DUF1202 family)